MSGPFRDLALLCAATVLGSVSAWADPGETGRQFAGRFARTGGTVFVKARPSPGDFTVSLTRDTGHCSGALSGRGKAYLSTVVTLSEADPAGGTTCTVDLLYSLDFTSLDVKESAACLVWHGAGCDFQGTYRRRH